MAHCERSRHVVGNGLSHHELQRISNVCGVSGIELIIIIAAAVIFLGPDKLPDLARTVGKLARELRSATDGFTQAKDEFTRSIDPKKLIGDGETKSQPRRRPASAASRDAAAIAAIRVQKEKGKAAESLTSDATASSELAAQSTDASDASQNESSESEVAINEDAAKNAPLSSGANVDVGAFTAPPLDAKKSADDETDWLRKRLQDAAKEREQRMESVNSARQKPALPQIRPAVGSIAVGENGSPAEIAESEREAPSTADSAESTASTSRDSSVRPDESSERSSS